jgi:TPR repeat protein
MVSRALTTAIGVGVLLGGVMALVPPRKGTVPRPEPSAVRAPAVVASASEGTEAAEPPAAPSALPSPAKSAPPVTTAVRYDLIASPHDSHIETEVELRKSERLCIRDIADECVRVADAYVAAKLVKQDRRRARQYQNLAFKAYIRKCEGQDPGACYALARMYLYGDSVKANPLHAQNLMKRVVDLCRYRPDDICSRLANEAPVAPKSIGRQR